MAGLINLSSPGAGDNTVKPSPSRILVDDSALTKYLYIINDRGNTFSERCRSFVSSSSEHSFVKNCDNARARWREFEVRGNGRRARTRTLHWQFVLIFFDLTDIWNFAKMPSMAHKLLSGAQAEIHGDEQMSCRTNASLK